MGGIALAKMLHCKNNPQSILCIHLLKKCAFKIVFI